MMELTFTGKDLPDILGQISQFMQTQSAGGKKAEASAPQTQPAEPSKPAANSDLTVEDVAASLKAHMKKHGKDSAIAILAEFNAKRASDVEPGQRGAIVERLQS